MRACAKRLRPHYNGHPHFVIHLDEYSICASQFHTHYTGHAHYRGHPTADLFSLTSLNPSVLCFDLLCSFLQVVLEGNRAFWATKVLEAWVSHGRQAFLLSFPFGPEAGAFAAAVVSAARVRHLAEMVRRFVGKLNVTLFCLDNIGSVSTRACSSGAGLVAWLVPR